MLDQEKWRDGLRLSSAKRSFPPLSCFDCCEVAMNSPSIPPKTTRGATGAEMLGIAVFVGLVLAIVGFAQFKDLLIGPKSGGYGNIGAIVGEWQAAAHPWHIVLHELHWFCGTRLHGTRHVSAFERGKCLNQHEERQRFYGNVSGIYAQPVRPCRFGERGGDGFRESAVAVSQK